MLGNTTPLDWLAWVGNLTAFAARVMPLAVVAALRPDVVLLVVRLGVGGALFLSVWVLVLGAGASIWHCCCAPRRGPQGIDA